MVRSSAEIVGECTASNGTKLTIRKVKTLQPRVTWRGIDTRRSQSSKQRLCLTAQDRPEPYAPFQSTSSLVGCSPLNTSGFRLTT